MYSTVKQVIDFVQSLRNPVYSEDILCKWLNECEGKVQTDIMKLAPSSCHLIEWTHSVSQTGVVFTASTIKFSKNTDFYAGETISLSGCAVAANNTSAKISEVSYDGTILTFASGIFTEDTETAAVTAVSDRSSTELLVPEPFAKLYAEYVIARIDFEDDEFPLYDNRMQMFNQFYSEYAGWYMENG